MARKVKPASPEEIQRKAAERRRKDFEAVGLSPEMADLVRNAGIEPTRAGDQREGQTVKEDTARRLDVFSALREGMAKGAYDAARRLERDMLVRRGLGDRGQRTERVDFESTLDLTDLIIIAAQGCDYVKARLSLRDWWLLNELIQPSYDRGDWRAHVLYVTGETNWNAQGAAVRAVCVNLRDAYEELDVGARKAA